MNNLSRKGLLMSALICGNVFLGGTTVFAEEIGDYQLDEMVVTATRTEESNIKVASVVSVITADDIKKKNILTITDALKEVAGIYDGRPGGMSDTANGIQMRGFGEADILVLYDGMPLNDGFNGKADWSVIAIDDVKKIEVLQGAASSLYGGHAVGGVINIIGKSPDKDHVHVYAKYGSDKTKKQGITLSKKLSDKWSMGLGYENKETDGHYKKLIYKYAYKAKDKPGNPDKIGTGAVLNQHSNGRDMYILGNPGGGRSEDDTYNFKLQYKFNDAQSLTYRYTHDKYKYFATDPETFIKDSQGNKMFEGSVLLPNGKYLDFNEYDFTDYDGRRTTDRHALTYKDTANKIDFKLGVTNVKDFGYATGDDLAGKGGGYDTSYPNKTYKADFQKVWEGSKNNIVAGFDIEKGSMDYSSNWLDHWGDKDSASYLYYTMGGTNLVGAVFVQDAIKLSDVYSLDLGLRVDYYQKKDGYYKEHGKDNVERPTEKYTELSPKVAFRYIPDDDTTYYASYGHSFNPPTLYQLYRSNSSFEANPDLKPETTDTVEVGLKKQFSPKLYSSLSIYQAKSKDLIDYDYLDSGKKQYMNLSSVKRQGIELMLDYKMDDKFSTFANLTLQNATDDTTGAKLYSIPKQILKAGLKYNYGDVSAYIDGQYVSSRTYDGQLSGKLYSDDAFFTADAGINYKFMKNATLSFAVNNIFDRDYWQWYKAGGRSWILGVDFDF